MLPSYWFGWFEYLAAILKVIALFTFVIAGFAMVLGAGPKGYLHHGDGWKNDPFKNGFKGFSSSVLLAILAIGGMYVAYCCGVVLTLSRQLLDRFPCW